MNNNYEILEIYSRDTEFGISWLKDNAHTEAFRISVHCRRVNSENEIIEEVGCGE